MSTPLSPSAKGARAWAPNGAQARPSPIKADVGGRAVNAANALVQPSRNLQHRHPFLGSPDAVKRAPAVCCALPFGPTGGSSASGSPNAQPGLWSGGVGDPANPSGGPSAGQSATRAPMARRRLDLLSTHAAATHATETAAQQPAIAAPLAGNEERREAEGVHSGTGASSGRGVGLLLQGPFNGSRVGPLGASGLLSGIADRSRGGSSVLAALDLQQLPQMLAELTHRPPSAPAAKADATVVAEPASAYAQEREELLSRLHCALAGGAVRAAELLAVPGMVAFLAEGLEPAVQGPQQGHAGRQSAATGMALECLCTLLTEDVTSHLPALLPAISRTLAVLHASRPLGALPAPALAPPFTRHPPADGAWAWPPAPVPDSTAAGAGWDSDVSCAFFAASLLVRAARYPTLAAAAVEGGGLQLLVRLMGCRPPMLAQMAVFAVYKLAKPGVPSPAGVGQVAAVEDAKKAAVQRQAALLAVAQAGGMGALCRCLEGLEDRPSRDMASSLMLDMALVPQVPAVVARLGHVRPLVAVMSSQGVGGGAAGGDIARMYALLVLARLCNHCPECQMDAVRDGALEPLLQLVRRGNEEEATHACRLLAILAQAVPTHGRFKEMQLVQCVLPLLRVGERGPERGSVVAEHASSLLAVLAQNPDMHFHIVGCGTVPVLVALLARGAGSSDRTQSYVLASLMLLVEGEQRHAAVVVRAGAVPALVAAVCATSVGGQMQHYHQQPQLQQRSVSIQEFSAAVLCNLSRYPDMQAELVSYGAVPALAACLGRGSPDAAVHAAEALFHLLTGDTALKRAVAGDNNAVNTALRMLAQVEPSSSAQAPPSSPSPSAVSSSAASGSASASWPNARYWALQLLRVLSTDDEALSLVAGLPNALGQRSGGAGTSVQPGGRWATLDRPAGVLGLALMLAAAEAGTVGGMGAEREPADTDGERAKELVGALVGLLLWREEQAGWQQARCRALAAWMLARLCTFPTLAPLLLGSGAVRALTALLAEEQEKHRALAAAAAAAAQGMGEAGGELYLHLPLLPGEDDLRAGLLGAGGLGSGGPSGGAGAVEPPSRGAAFSAHRGGSVRGTRFDLDGGAAASAALLIVSRLGQEGQMAVMAEVALQEWMGTPVRVEGLGQQGDGGPRKDAGMA